MNKYTHSAHYDLRLLRGWQRDQLRLLKEFTEYKFVSQTKLSGASGMQAGSHALGGKITPLTRAELIKKAGRDEDGKYLWILNEDKIEKSELRKLLDEIGI